MEYCPFCKQLMGVYFKAWGKENQGASYVVQCQKCLTIVRSCTDQDDWTTDVKDNFHILENESWRDYK